MPIVDNTEDYMSYFKKTLLYLIESLKTVFTLLDRNSTRYDVLIISNGMSMSGAPMVLQNVVDYFIANGYTPLLLFEHDGPLRKHCKCKTNCCFFFESIIQKIVLKRKYKYIFVNTIAAYRWINRLEKSNLRYNLWIHEGEEYFSKLRKYLPDVLTRAMVFYVSKVTLDCLSASGIVCNATALAYPFDAPESFKSFDFSSTTRTVMLVGSVCKRKNQIELLDAVAQLSSQLLKSVQFIFVGSPIEHDYWNMFTQKASELSNIQVIEFLDHSKLMELYKEVFLCVCTSIDDPLPVTVTEAIFSKRVVLVSSGTGHFDFIQNGINGFCYETHNVEDLSHKISDVLELSNERYSYVAEKAYETLSDIFSRKRFCDTLDNNLQCCIEL